MITTIPHDEIVHHRFLLAPHSKLWRRVVLEQCTPFFLVKYEDRDADCWVGETAIYWDLQDLLRFCAATTQADNRRLVQVALLTPSTANHKTGWHMQDIKEIWEGQSPQTKTRIVEYVTAEGLRYVDGPGRQEEGALTKVFSVSAFNGLEADSRP